jgi:hypothetical protein
MNGKKWKWWNFVVAGLLLGTCGGFEFYSGQISKAIGSELLAAMGIAIGLFSRKSEAKGKTGEAPAEPPDSGEGTQG